MQNVPDKSLSFPFGYFRDCSETLRRRGRTQRWSARAATNLVHSNYQLSSPELLTNVHARAGELYPDTFFRDTTYLTAFECFKVSTSQFGSTLKAHFQNNI